MKKKNYDDIINLSHYVSKKHPQMSLEARAVQFAPFAALTGFDEEIEEAERLTSDKKIFDENVKEILDRKIKIIKEKIREKPLLIITYFVHDLKKSGGSYTTTSSNIKKIDEYRNLIVLENKLEIPITEIIDITGDIFNNYNI